MHKEDTELLDIYNAKGEYLGVKLRDQVHRDGDWHRTFHCWVIFQDPKTGVQYIVLQRRSNNKSSWPGKFDITAAGHYLAGEKLEDGVREVQEELGIQISIANLVPLGVRVCIEEFEPGRKNYEFQDIFFLVKDIRSLQYKIDEFELSGLFIAKISDILSLMSLDVKKISVYPMMIGDNIGLTEPIIIDMNSFPPSLDKYIYKIIILAMRLFNHEDHLLI